MNYKLLAKAGFDFLKEKGLLDEYLRINYRGIQTAGQLAKWMERNPGDATEFINYTATWSDGEDEEAYSDANTFFEMNWESLCRSHPSRIKALAKAREDA